MKNTSQSFPSAQVVEAEQSAHANALRTLAIVRQTKVDIKRRADTKYTSADKADIYIQSIDTLIKMLEELNVKVSICREQE